MQENKYIKNLISKMDLDQKIGNVLTLGFTGTLVTPNIYESILKYNCGGLRLTPSSRQFGSYVDPKTGKTVVNIENSKGYKKGVPPAYITPAQYHKILEELQELAISRPLGIPLHFSFDQEGDTSANYNFGGVNIFPMPMGIRATGDSKLAYEVALAVARQSRAVGFNWIHSPVLDINVNPDNPEIYTRAYSDRVEEVIEYAEQACRGFKEGGLIATGKHFPGRGDSDIDAHYEMPIINVDKDKLYKREILPYKVLIEKKLLPVVMVAHSIYPAIDEKDVATVSKPIITGLLREKLGFDGVVTTDSMTMAGIAKRYGVANACAMALVAGADLVLMKAENYLVDETFNTIKKYVEKGKLSEDELDQKVYRVLKLKYDYGLFYKGNFTDEDPEDVINDKKIVFINKIVAKKSVIVARDRKGILPLSQNDKILIVEQITKCPNDFYWHPGLLFKNCLKYNRNIRYLEISFTADNEDIENIRNLIREFKTIIITNYYERGKTTNNELIKEIVKNKNKNIVVVTNTPYRLSIPDEADTVVITFSTGYRNIEVVAGVLFGKIKPEGEWPIEYTLPN